MENRIKLLITDFDGTLVNTFEANFRAYNEAFEEAGLELTRERYSKCFGHRFDDFMNDVGIGDEKVKSKIRSRKAENYPRYFDKLTVNSSLLEFIRSFHRQGGLTAIASTAWGRNLRSALDYIGATGDFDLILSGENVIHGKPNPEIYRKVLESFDVRSHEALVFEDSEVGFRAAQAAGISVIPVFPEFFPVADGSAHTV